MRKLKTFVLKDIFNYDNEFNTYLMSLIAAHNDLLISNNYRIKQKPYSHDQDYFYFYKMSVGHLREAIKLIESFWEKYKDKLYSTEGFSEKFYELDKLVGGFNNKKDSYWSKVLKRARDGVVSHYCGKENFSMYSEILKEIPDSEEFEFIYGDTNGDRKYAFIEMIQYSSIITLSEKYFELTEEITDEKLETIEMHFSKLMAKTMYFLKSVIDFFFIQKIH